MLISVIIPVYNCRPIIEKTIRLIQQSGLTDFEVIIVDDGSNDGTGPLCGEISGKNSNLRYIYQDNSGVSSARNCGIKNALGDYLLFFDADDSVDPGAYKKAVSILQECRPDILSFGHTFDFWFHGILYRRDEMQVPFKGEMKRAEIGSVLPELYQCNALSPVWNKFVKTELLIKNQIRFNESMIEMEDFLFSIKCLSSCDSLYMLPQIIYHYRQSEDEMNTFRRLCRIDSLSEYMRPIEEGLNEAAAALELKDKEKENAESIADQIYLMLFNEIIRFGSEADIKKASEDMMLNQYRAVAAGSDPLLYDLIEKGNFKGIVNRYRVIRLRHWAAVRAKSIKNRGRYESK